MDKHAVIIAGGGPTGLMLAGELALAGVDVAVVERRPDQELAGTRAGGLHARTLEVLDQRGIGERFLSQGKTGQFAGYAWIPLGMADLPTRHPYVLALAQNRIERILAEWVGSLPVAFYRGREVTGFSQDATGVDVLLSEGRPLRAGYLVGCDGGRSVVRKAAGIGFPGWEPTISNLIAEARMSGEPPWGLRRDRLGIHSLGKMEDGATVRILLTEPTVGRTGEPGLEDLRETLTAVYGSDFGIHGSAWISRFTDAARQAAEYRKGRVLLAGDSAHVHYPTGGQGLNTGVQDAVNLGWKLAQVVKGISPESLLDTYHAERHPVAAQVLRNTMAQVALLRTDDRTEALRETMARLLAMDEPRKRTVASLTALDVHYDMGAGHPLLGRRMPDLDLSTAEGTVRAYSFLHRAEPVLLVFGAGDLGPVPERVRYAEAKYEGPWELPSIGPVAAPSAVLIRPDGHVAWVGEGSRDGLDAALSRWFGV